MPNWLPNVEKDQNSGRIISDLSIIGPLAGFSCFPEEEVNEILICFFFFIKLIPLFFIKDVRRK